MSKNEKLQEYFNFTQSDLQANRQGRVTEDQRSHVKGKVQRYNSRILIVLGVMVFISFIAAFAFRFATAAANSSANIFESLPIGMIGPVITVVILVVFMVSRTQKKNDFSLQRAEGTVNFVWVEERVRNSSNAGPTYKTVRKLQMRVGGTSFNVSENLMDIINQGDNVRFYYTGGGDIVSAEFIDKP